METADVVVVGAGAVGLACAARLAAGGASVVVLERHGSSGQETSSRNSGVIHAGLYYPPDSLKAHTCVRGRELLYARCVRDGVAHRRTGKLVVATEDAERPVLATILERGQAAGAGELRIVEGAELRKLEPHVRAVAGLWSPNTGIVDAHGLMDSYRAEATAHGAAMAFTTALDGIEPQADDSLVVQTRTADGERFTLRAGAVINAAGLESDRVAAAAGLDVDALGYRIHPCKGDYFGLAPRLRGMVSHLVYPVPAGPGLGIHLTMDLGGKLTAGPDAEYVEAPRYDVKPAKAADFARAVRRYLPEVHDDDLTPDYAGVRPKLAGPGTAFADFVIESAAAHGMPRLVNLIGIESPGLTASEAIAERVQHLLAE
ncbi:MAG: NAD(P)/FAD-dependent oxidoreductase [Myxococcales bacterium]|jgi:L-2-hydroxyglutarate oxidase LhgO